MYILFSFYGFGQLIRPKGGQTKGAQDIFLDLWIKFGKMIVKA